MPRPSAFLYANHLVGGNLADEITKRRAAGESYDSIARWLLIEHEVTVTGETVRRWMGRHVPARTTAA